MSAAATAVPAADRVLHVLAALARQGRAMAVGELMVQTGLARSTLYRQLARLRQWGFVLEHGGLYAPGPMSLQLAAGFDLASHLMQAARPVMQELAAQSQESVGLLVAVNGHAVCLDMVESSHSLRCSFDRGRSVPLRAGASALCLLAHLPAAQREALLNEQDIDSAARAALDQRLEAIAKAGCAVSEGEVDAGVWGCSVPLFSAPRRMAGVITLMAPTSRARGHEDALIRKTAVAAARIAQSLGRP